jgi:hypothetical protein
VLGCGGRDDCRYRRRSYDSGELVHSGLGARGGVGERGRRGDGGGAHHGLTLVRSRSPQQFIRPCHERAALGRPTNISVHAVASNKNLRMVACPHAADSHSWSRSAPFLAALRHVVFCDLHGSFYAARLPLFGCRSIGRVTLRSIGSSPFSPLCCQAILART